MKPAPERSLSRRKAQAEERVRQWGAWRRPSTPGADPPLETGGGRRLPRTAPASPAPLPPASPHRSRRLPRTAPGASPAPSRPLPRTAPVRLPRTAPAGMTRPETRGVADGGCGGGGGRRAWHLAPASADGRDATRSYSPKDLLDEPLFDHCPPPLLHLHVSDPRAP